MTDAAKLLRPYLTDIARIGGARAASVFLPLSAGTHAPGILVHTADTAAVPELADVETAVRFSFGCEAAGRQTTSVPLRDTVVRSSAEEGGLLVPIPRLATLLQPAGNGEAPAAGSRRAVDRVPLLPGSGWIGLRFGSNGTGPAPDDLLSGTLPLVPLLDLARNVSCYLAGVYGILVEPVTGLPGRAVLQALVVDEFERARLSRRPFALVFVNPRDFGSINARFGPRTGDQVLREIARQLRSALRSTDPVMRYGAAIFAVPLVMTSSEAALAVGEKIRRRLSQQRFLDGRIRLEFNVGTATFEPSNEDDGHDPWNLVQRADLALAAAREAGAARAIAWRPELETEDAAGARRIGGIFTGRIEKDFRNMGLLWEALSAVNAEGSPRQLASRVAHKLLVTLTAQCVAFVEVAPDRSLALVSRVIRTGHGGAGPIIAEQETLADGEAALLARAVGEKRAVRGSAGREGDSRMFAPAEHAVPLMAGANPIGALYVAGRQGEFALDNSDVAFLTAFAAQVAVALDRARLAEQEDRRRDREQEQLRAELRELRTAVGQSKILYGSPAMETVLAAARRAATTDATVLITGESGTGKERLAHLVHESSARRDRPFVIVDCGSIPATLIESELFGHERGAFTSAQQRATGRLALAHGGTVVLDEIGELPLEVQARLLRFVQEKQVTPVGGVRARPVDVRIIAVTNRNLEEDVAAGRFREDLFYRLNVVRLRTPPLRERGEDILLLAHHFLQVFSVQYHKPIRSISHAAQELMLAHAWPGNVRELENRILQAVILTQGDVLDETVLGFQAGPRSTAPAVRAQEAAPPATAGSDALPSSPDDDPWRRLRVELGHQIQASLEASGSSQLPIGRWLAHETALLAYEIANRVGSRAAALTASPETTFARRLEKAQADAMVSVRSATWSHVREALRAVLLDPFVARQGCVFTRLDDALLQEVKARTGSRDDRTAAQLLGISVPTLRRWLASSAPLFSNL